MGEKSVARPHRTGGGYSCRRRRIDMVGEQEKAPQDGADPSGGDGERWEKLAEFLVVGRCRFRQKIREKPVIFT